MRSSGTFIAICGPSGAGKDTVLRLVQAGMASRPELVFARRCITRDESENEKNEAISPVAFETMRKAGAFLLQWNAHGLSYGLPIALKSDLEAGRSVIANLSRGALAAARALPFKVVSIEISASPEVLATRLARRGREDAAHQQARLDRNALYAAGVGADHVILNDGTPEAACFRLVALIEAILANGTGQAP